ncbi:sigma-70 family RNA polymerase sigma factor [uncultured Chitinophaga sp.]|uniref:RNA polymerase sigma factor n=1 Tax=uncultured Chitinophaga sp. TaxID=339340 RepID=UPI0025CEB9A2|nr:sigma-70 family RNA polymerase sigma factor [uncultured Chitinophaga sp.]
MQDDNIATALLGRIADGDIKAFSSFYTDYSPAVYHTALAFTKGDQSLCEEIVQVVFIRIWENRAKLPAMEKPADYLFTLARNIIFDIFKDRARQLERHLQLQQQEQGLPNTPINILAAKEYANIFKSAVAALPPQQRRIYELAREEGVSHAEIAEMLGLSIQTVRTHLKLATRSVRQYVGEHIEQTDLLLLMFLIYNAN